MALLAICVSLFARGAFGQNASRGLAHEQYADSDGYAVLSALLDHERPSKGRILVLAPETSSGIESDSFEACKTVPAEFKSAARDFKKKNQRTLWLARKFILPFEYEFADQFKQEDVLPHLPRDQVPSLATARTIYVVSAVGFDETRTRAIAYLALSDGTEGNGGYRLLKNNKYGWAEVNGSPACQFMSFNRAGSFGKVVS